MVDFHRFTALTKAHREAIMEFLLTTSTVFPSLSQLSPLEKTDRYASVEI